MCLGALYWARPKLFYYAAGRDAAAAAGFDDAFIYNELSLPADRRSIPGYCVSAELGGKPFEEWAKSGKKIGY
jgi:guanine deaminase